MLVKLLIPLALAATVLVAAVSARPHEAPLRPAPSRSLQLHR